MSLSIFGQRNHLVKSHHSATEILGRFPKSRKPLPPEYQAVYASHYLKNREGKTAYEVLQYDWGTTKFVANMLNQAGAAYFFKQNANGAWVEAQKITPSFRATNSYFGNHVAVHGDRY